MLGSFETPEYTTNTIAIGTLRILEAIRKNQPKIKFYNASTSEMYGDTNKAPQNEKQFLPQTAHTELQNYIHIY